MKKIQASTYVTGASVDKGSLRFPIAFVCLLVCSSLHAQENHSADVSAEAHNYRSLGAGSLAKADSLFKIKQYVQSLELYQGLFQQKIYSPSMLLKMAYIDEGLGHLSQSLYFMNLYYKVSHDQRALVKIEEVAAKNKLEGYTPSEYAWIFAFLEENYSRLAAILVSAIILIVALEIYQKRRSKNILALAVIQIVFLAALLVLNNFAAPTPQGIIANPSTYLMSGPSAAAQVVGIVGEGHEVEILGHRDVWLKIKWLDKDVYVKGNAVLPVHL